MCIPKPEIGAAPPVAVPSQQSASALELGGDANRGASMLGRLQLRLSGTAAGNPSAPAPAATAVQITTPAAAPVNSVVASSAKPNTSDQGQAFTTPNAGLRLGTSRA